MADGSADRPGRVLVAGRGRRGSLVNTLGADPPGPESGWPEGSGKQKRRGVGVDRRWREGAGPSAAPRRGRARHRGIWAGGAGFSLAPTPRGQHAGCLPPGPRAPPGGQAYWHLTTVLTLPLPAPSQRPGPGPPGRTPVIRGSPQPRPSPRPQMVWDTLTPERRPRTWVSAEVRTPCGCYI